MKRYISSALAIMVVLLVCVLTTIGTDPTNPASLPKELKLALGLDTESIILEQLGYGLKAYDIWITMDLISIFVSIIVGSCYLNCAKADGLSQLEIVETRKS
jgi:hypothetical protein